MSLNSTLILIWSIFSLLLVGIPVPAPQIVLISRRGSRKEPHAWSGVLYHSLSTAQPSPAQPPTLSSELHLLQRSLLPSIPGLWNSLPVPSQAVPEAVQCGKPDRPYWLALVNLPTTGCLCSSPFPLHPPEHLDLAGGLYRCAELMGKARGFPKAELCPPT